MMRPCYVQISIGCFMYVVIQFGAIFKLIYRVQLSYINKLPLHGLPVAV